MKISRLHRRFLQEAERAARNAGALLRKRVVGKQIRISSKGGLWNNLVTEFDVASEKLIVKQLLGAFPDHDILAEERRYPSSGGQYKWIVDPLDGTTNFAHGYPVFCVSIALEEAGEVIIGVVYNPNQDELFTAVKGGGSFLNSKPITVSAVRNFKRSLMSTGFPPQLDERLDRHIENFARVLRHAHGVRRAGSAAMDLCYVASGRCEGFYEIQLNPWDLAAGVLIVREAGGKVTGYDGKSFNIYDGDVVATNGRIHRAALQLLNR